MVKQYYKTIQKRAYTTKDAYEEFRWLLRDCNDLRASAIIQRRDEWRGRRNKINLNHQSKEVTALRKEEERWNRISHLIPRGVVRTVDKAFKNFFKSGFGYPRIEHKTKTIEINEKNAVLKTLVKYHQNKVIVRIKGLKSIHVPIKEPMPDIEELRKFSISLKAGKLYVNFVFKDYPEELPKTGKSVGIDLGVRERLVVSDGTRYPARERNTRIDNLNRKLSRKKKGSRSWHKTRAELSREYHRDAVKNRNDCHQIAHELVKENDRITFEDLPIKNMTKSAKGTKNKPGKNVAQKRGLNRSIKTQTWGTHSQFNTSQGRESWEDR